MKKVAGLAKVVGNCGMIGLKDSLTGGDSVTGGLAFGRGLLGWSLVEDRLKKGGSRGCLDAAEELHYRKGRILMDL